MISGTPRTTPATVVLQAYDAPFIPDWIRCCLESARHWSSEQNFAYQCLSDGFFARSPAWFRERCGAQLGPVTDMSRLLLMQDLLDQGYENVIWIDADVLVFNRPMLQVDVSRGFLAVYEMTLAIEPDGSARVAGPTVNGAVICARKDHPVLAFYRHAVEEVVRNFRGSEIPRTIAGPNLLTRIAQIVPVECLTTVGLFTPAMLRDIARAEDRLARIFIERFGYPVAAANLCHFYRNEVDDAARAEFDAVTLTAVERLLASQGDCINRFLRTAG